MEEAKNVFEELISLYDIADELENIGNDKVAEEMRNKLKLISEFLVKEFGL
jgi:hypothetical protein